MKSISIKHNTLLCAVVIAAASWLTPTSNAEAQNTRYSNSRVIHRAGKWYRTDYQDSHQRLDQYTNGDTFDEGQGSTADDRGMEPNDFQIRMQKVHEYREVVYINPGRIKTLTVPSTRNGTYSSFSNYQRWYNYRTDGDIDHNFITLSRSQEYRMQNGTFGGQFIGGSRNALCTVTVNAPDNFTGEPYYLACDMSDYTDDADVPSRNGDVFYEPTLGQRVIYIITPASVIKDQMSRDSYYEVHDIHLPTVRTSDNTLEQVALNMFASNYFVPGENGDCGKLTVSIDYGEWTNGRRYITLDGANGDGEVILSENARIISFDQYDIPDTEDGSTLYINVEKDGYKVAQFKLTFDAGTESMSLSDLEAVVRQGEGATGYERTNAYLEANYTKLTSLDFDFDNVNDDNTVDGKDYYPYPLDWSTSTYGFYAGSGNINDPSNCPQWGQYAITSGNGYRNGRVNLLESTTLGLNSRYHLYVDADQYPGTVCELPFETDLCQSSRLFVTAWVKNVNQTNSDGGVFFILKGVYDDETRPEVIIHTQSSGQISSNGQEGGIWRQVYFEFTSPGGYDFDHYELELYNNCLNSTGGDYCVDDIRVYLSPLVVEGKSTQPLCSSKKEAQIQVNINFGMLLDRVGYEENTTGQGSETITGYYSFVNKRAFDAAIAAGRSYQEAFAEAVVHGQGVYHGSQSEYFGSINISTYFWGNDGQGGMAGNNGGRGDNREITFNADVTANSAGDGYTTLIAGDEYYIAFTQNDIAGNTDVSALAEAFDMDDLDCGIRGTFVVEGPLIVNVNGDVESDAETVCIGQQPLVDITMRDGQGGKVESAVFDWYFGSLQEFWEETTEPIGDGGTTHTLEQALEQFRHFYPTAHAVSDATVPAEDPDNKNFKLYQEDIDLIERLNEDYSLGGLNPKLTLSASRDLSIRLMQTQTYVVLIPIGTMPEGTTNICWEPTQVILHAQDGAPLLDVGRNDVDYSGAGTGYAVKVRMGLAQYNALNQLYVSVRNPRLYDGTSTTVTSVRNERNVYLTWTDDPDYADNINEHGGYYYVVGSVEDFTIQSTANPAASRVALSFDKSKFSPREGYHYSLALRFTTQLVDDVDCYGNLVIPIVIVPDYQVWIGNKTGNWNDDANWRRAEPDEIKKPSGSGYITNTVNGTSQGYVPLSATRVVIPRDRGVQLYEASASYDGILNLDAGKGDLSDPTENVEYDLVVSSTASGGTSVYSTALFYTNRCYQIHFDAGGQMLNSDLLTYNRAWTNIEVPANQWTVVATPLKGVYTGDWYTDRTGTEGSEYFTDITFDGTDNNRLQPYVVQRSWNGEASVTDTQHAGITSAVTSDVTWSSTYNAVDVLEQPGEGFSIKAGKGTATTDGGKVEFRLPKWDTNYEGFDATFQRVQVGSGLLFTDDLKTATSKSVEITPSQDGKYLIVGNPFTAHLDMGKFFDANTDLDKVYWTASGDPLTGVADPDGNWETSDGSSTAVVPPYTAFYVRRASASTQVMDITFSKDMAVMPAVDAAQATVLRGMTLRAENADGRSTALLAYGTNAENGFVTTEDVQLLGESDNAVPMVYTVAGSMATNINKVRDAQQIPLGVFAADDDVTTLTFTGVAALMEPSLYDAEMNTDTPLTEGYTLTVNGASHGRYFIRAKGAGEGTTGITDVETGDGGVSVYSVAPRQVVVSSGAELLEVSVYSVGGAMLGHESVGGGRTAVTLDGIDSGVAVVRVVTADGQTTRKLVVK